MVSCAAVLLIAGVARVYALDISQCIAPLGMESGLIPDEDLSASSSFNDGNVGPQNARLNGERGGGAWCPKSQITTESSEWLEVDLHQVHVITALGTQGRFGNGQGAEFAEAYVVEYWRPRLGKWVRYRTADGQEILSANSNTYLEKQTRLEPAIWASRVRFIPYSAHRRTVCLRVELYGCLWTAGIVSYSMPRGDARSNGVELTDVSYDGTWGEELRGGLGQLVDGRFGGDEIREASRPSAWVGWRNDSRPRPPAITVEFDRVREFTALHLYCNNRFMRDVQVFSEAVVTFSVGGHHFQREAVRAQPAPDLIFETSRNVTVALHHRIGKWVRVELHHAARWLLISEMVFYSDVAQGNFSAETVQPSVVASGTAGGRAPAAGSGGGGGAAVSTARGADPLYMAIVVGVLTALVILLALAVSLVLHRHRHRKCFTSPLGGGGAAGRELAADYTRCGTSSLPPAPHTVKLTIDTDRELKSDEYQEPYHALECPPYNSYSARLHEHSSAAFSDSSNYEYAVPELSLAPLLSRRGDGSVGGGGSVGGSGGGSGSAGGDSLTRRDTLPAHSLALRHTHIDHSPVRVRRDGAGGGGTLELRELQRRLESADVVELPRHRLRMISKLAEGAFGTVYVAEADGVAEYCGAVTSEQRLVAVKFLSHDAAPHEREEFERDVRILAALSSPHLARVLGVCRAPPLAVVLEYLEHGDLCAFLRSGPPPPQCALLHMAAQIAAGMRYLESLNFVHRDLAARNILVGKGYQVKISDFGTDNEVYSRDYYKGLGLVGVPLRWAAWESVLLDQYTTKSDVWAFAVTLYELFTLCRRPPYEHLTDDQVLENLRHMQAEDGMFEPLCRGVAGSCPRDLQRVMRDCWRRDDAKRPSFAHVHPLLHRLAYQQT